MYHVLVGGREADKDMIHRSLHLYSFIKLHTLVPTLGLATFVIHSEATKFEQD